jgi:hypothetical protein
MIVPNVDHVKVTLSADGREQSYEDLLSYADCTLFLWDTLERLGKNLCQGDSRETTITVRIEAS